MRQPLAMWLSVPAAPFLLSLAALGAAGQTSRLQPPAQTEWQKQLFQKVSQTAARLSDAAVPALLLKLDEPSFRQQLTECCPSMSQLSAKQLLTILQEETAVAEVASGFPAATSADMQDDLLTGMTIADGLAGSFFQNQWQGQLLHNSSFRKPMYEHVRSTVNTTAKTASLDIWAHSDGGCTSNATWSISAPLDVCTVSGVVLTQFTFNGTTLVQRAWRTQQFGPSSSPSARQRGWQRPTHWQSPPTETQPCPTTEPLFERSYVADGVCHARLSEWENNTIYFWQFEDTAEMALYGLKPFKKFGEPETLAETAERGVYSLVNLFLIDQGSPLFGDVSAVFSMAAVKSRALISAVDTGFFESQCNSSTPFGWFNLSANCSVYKPFEMLGTMEHFNHLLLTNDRFWTGNALARRFARLEGVWGTNPVTGSDAIGYFESVPAGTYLYPTDVRFLIGNFGSLFGSALGEQLQDWAIQRGWVLIWTLGFNFGEDTLSWMNFDDVDTVRRTANSRFVDPVVAVKSTAEASLPLQQTNFSSFRQVWAEMASKRHNGEVSNATALLIWRQLVSKMPAGLQVSPVRASSCTELLAAGRECVGVSGDSRCVCYAAGGPRPAVPASLDSAGGARGGGTRAAFSAALAAVTQGNVRQRESSASFVV